MVASLIKKDPDSLRNLCNLSPQMAQLRDAFCTSLGISPDEFIPLGLLISLTLVAVFHTSSFIPNLARTFISFPESYHTPCRHTPSHKKKIGLHGDGVPHTRKKTVEVFSWNFVAEPDADRFLATLIEKEFLCQCGTCHGRHTTDKVLELLCWSFR